YVSPAPSIIYTLSLHDALPIFQHLAHDDLDVLVVDINTLETVYALYLLDHVILHSPQSFDLQDIMGVHATLCELVAGLKLLSVLGLDARSVGDEVGLGLACLVVGDDDLTLFLCVVDDSFSCKLCDDGKTLRLS